MDTYKIDSNKIIFSNGFDIEFEFPVLKTLLIDSIIVILLEIPTKVIYNHNVFALTTTGDYLWRISDVKLFNNADNCPFIDIEVNSRNQLVLFNWCDTAIIMDYKTGAVLDRYNSK